LIKDSKLNNAYGKITINKDGSTNLNGVYAGGDAVNGGKEVVDAVQAGKDGAKGILSFLNLF
jgi:dihydropyrimidine dehydrogenase (NAD+) subunit PreT